VRPPARAPRDDRGVGSVLGLAMMGVLVSVTLAVGCGVSVVAAHRAAQAAADLAALAAAGALQDGEDPCASAAHIAGDNRAALRACRVDGWSVSVVVVTAAHLPVGRVELPARARAGPATT
jgi:secretion/DNA translocation related TadE-like protein